MQSDNHVLYHPAPIWFLSKGDHDQGENIADNGGSKVKSLFHLVKKIYTAAANSIPGSIPGVQKAASCWKWMCPWVQPNLRPAILGEPIKVFHMPFVSHFLGGSRPRLVHLEPEGCQLWLHPWWPFCCKQMSQTTKILTGIDLNMTLPEQRWPLPWTLEGECSFCQPASVCSWLQM